MRLSSFETALVLNNYFSWAAEPGRGADYAHYIYYISMYFHLPPPPRFSDLPLTLDSDSPPQS